MTYLVNEHSEESAGDYDDDVADVLLRESTGWHRADPATGELLPDEASGTTLDLDEDPDKTPPSAGDPDGGDADTEKE